MAQVPECVVCLQPYDDYIHVPRVLACGHSFCELCLMQLQSTWQRPLSSSSTGDSKSQSQGALIRCPECSHRTKLPVGGQQSLPKNVELLRLLPSLIKETESSAFGEEHPGKKIEASLSCRAEGKQNRVASRRGASEDRRRSKEKGLVDSSCSSSEGLGAASWLIPCWLYSGNAIRDVRPWIVPEKAIKIREKELQEEEDANSRINVSQRELLRGEIMLEQDGLSSNVPVTLLQLQLNCPTEGETLSYEQLVLKAWEEGFQSVANTELLFLFRISFLGHRLCKVFGLWMNKGNHLFLVTETPLNGIVSAWDLLINFQPEISSRMQKSHPSEMSEIDLMNLNGKQETKSSASSGNDINSLMDGVFQLQLQKSPAAENALLTKLGLMRGLCEILLELHSQGLIIGMLSPPCLVVDHFGNLLFHINAALNERFSLLEAIPRYRGSSTTKANVQGEGNRGPSASQNSRNCWQYMSPEVLALLVHNLPDCEEANANKAPENALGIVQGHITCKADVWSLGCMLLELLSGKAPQFGLSFSQVLQSVLFERKKPLDSLSLDALLNLGTSESISQEYPRMNAFKDLLIKCFEHVPEDRPQISELWLSLMDLGLSTFILRGTFTEHRFGGEAATTADKKFWILSPPGFVIDGVLEPWEGKQPLERLPLEAGNPDDGRDLQSCGLELKGSLAGHNDYVTVLLVCGDHLLSASFDKTIRVWSLEDLELQRTFEGHTHVVNALAMDQNASRCFSGDSNGTICAWKLGVDSGPPLIATWQEHNDWRYTGVASLAVAADGILYNGSGDRTIKAWSLQNFTLLGTMEGHKSVVSTLLVDGELLYSGSWDGTILVWWRSDQSCVAVLSEDITTVASLGGVRSLCISDSLLFAGRDNGAIQDRSGAMKNA